MKYKQPNPRFEHGLPNPFLFMKNVKQLPSLIRSMALVNIHAQACGIVDYIDPTEG